MGGVSFFKLLRYLVLGDPLTWFRICQYRDWLFPIKNLIYKICSKRRMIDLPVETKVGYGLYIGHGMCIVVNKHTIIGNNVNLSQFVNIGANRQIGAVICDNVYVAPMTCLVENVQIGFNSIIGAGSVVVKNVPSRSTYAGVPAKKISDNFVENIMNEYKIL